jgi:hypothetical protein
MQSFKQSSIDAHYDVALKVFQLAKKRMKAPISGRRFGSVPSLLEIRESNSWDSDTPNNSQPGHRRVLANQAMRRILLQKGYGFMTLLRLMAGYFSYYDLLP